MTASDSENESAPTQDPKPNPDDGADAATRAKFRAALDAKKSKQIAGKGTSHNPNGPVGGGDSSRAGGSREFRRKSGG